LVFLLAGLAHPTAAKVVSVVQRSWFDGCMAFPRSSTGRANVFFFNYVVFSGESFSLFCGWSGSCRRVFAKLFRRVSPPPSFRVGVPVWPVAWLFFLELFVFERVVRLFLRVNSLGFLLFPFRRWFSHLPPFSVGRSRFLTIGRGALGSNVIVSDSICEKSFEAFFSWNPPCFSPRRYFWLFFFLGVRGWIPLLPFLLRIDT